MRSWGFFLSGLFLLAALAACAGPPEAPPPATLRLTIVPPTPLPTAAPWPTLTPHVYCDSSAESFLIVGERGRVRLRPTAERLNLRAGPGRQFEALAQLAPLESFWVLDGPECGGPYVWYKVQYRGLEGWIAEGFEGQYFAEPWLPG